MSLVFRNLAGDRATVATDRCFQPNERLKGVALRRGS